MASSPLRTRLRSVLHVTGVAVLALTSSAFGFGPPDTPDPAVPATVPFEVWAEGDCPSLPADRVLQRTRRVAVHHTHMPTAAHVDDVPDILNEICRGHLTRGFDTIGYHYLVDPWGRIWEARGDVTMPSLHVQGAHAAGFNEGTVGVAFIGDHETAPPTAAAVDAAVEIIAWLTEHSDLDPNGVVTMTSVGGEHVRHAAGADVTLPVVGGHRETSETSCPGEHLVALLPEIRDRVARRAHDGPARPDLLQPVLHAVASDEQPARDVR